ncbi:biopolymer transporter Tol, partial [bacterium]|nr:biopolymer transporter Tol [bacterium]
MKKLTLFLIFLLVSNVFSQFGQNKVQYRTFSWSFIQSKHFDVYYYENGKDLAEFAAVAAESAYVSISKTFNYQITKRIPIVVYNSHNEFQQTNVSLEYLEEGIGGFTEIFKNRVVLPYEGSYEGFRHVLHHELVHAVVNDLFFGGNAQSIVTGAYTNLPLWWNEGLAEFESLDWDTQTDLYLRDAVINNYLPPVEYLYGFMAYRGGQSIWKFIAEKYGREKIAEIIAKTRLTKSIEGGFKSATGLDIKTLDEQWSKNLKKIYWPEVTDRLEPTDFAKKLTD